ncbi:MAG: type II secretion system F family protein [Candidatus Thiodiazotropha sp. (ex Lucinoma borealis)]|nr:type II secretion system F family protein [Candidatus Thiodiazotropha sp. (ex Lucinoma borealis)]MCU7866769.1 type II secretion system F family protein [Candidatus Thiodiazotropha sp. (ex Lucinoma borealis)]
MPLFVYAAYSRTGNLIRGERAARSAAELKQNLLQEDLLPATISRKIGLSSVTFKARQLGSDDYSLLVKELIALLRAGLPIPEVLTLLAQRPGQPAIQRVLTQVIESIQHGSTLSAACRLQPDFFDNLFITACATGEASGQLVNALEHYQESLRRSISLRKSVRQALVYPIFLLLVLTGVLSALFFIILPRFTAMYSQLGTALPGPTQLLLNLVEQLPVYLLVAMSIGLALWIALKVLANSEVGHEQLDSLKSKIPVVGPLYSTYGMAKLTRTLATLIDAGAPLLSAMETTAAGLDNRQLGNALQKSAKQISEGAHLANAFTLHQVLTPTALKIVEAGELSGRLSEMLGEVADYYEEWLEERLRGVTSMIEPIMMLLIGLLVGGVIIVMYLPVFGMADLIQ